MGYGWLWTCWVSFSITVRWRGVFSRVGFYPPDGVKINNKKFPSPKGIIGVDSLQFSHCSADSASVCCVHCLSEILTLLVPLSGQDSQREKYHLPFRTTGCVAYSPGVIHERPILSLASYCHPGVCLRETNGFVLMSLWFSWLPSSWSHLALGQTYWVCFGRGLSGSFMSEKLFKSTLTFAPCSV